MGRNAGLARGGAQGHTVLQMRPDHGEAAKRVLQALLVEHGHRRRRACCIGRDREGPETASENTTAVAQPRRGRAGVALAEPFTAVLDEYMAALKRAPLSEQTRRTYASKVRQFLAWRADADRRRRPLNAKDARDWAVRDCRSPCRPC